MADFQVITRERHGLQHWLKHSSYTFAAGDALCPLVAQELPKAITRQSPASSRFALL